MRVVVTCGPSYEPIDEVRRLTNFSTGELGVLLANRLTRAGFEVSCFKGAAATCPLRVEGARLFSFTTGENLRAQLAAMEHRGQVAAVFHAAALSDYLVGRVVDRTGQPVSGAKIPSRAGELTVTLTPAPKLIEGLPSLFPNSRIVGWKYELVGSQADALEAAERQMAGAGSHACVVNGRAFGQGFGFCEPGAEVVLCPDKTRLAAFLARWIERTALSTQPA